MTNKELVKAFVQECIDVQKHKSKFKANHIDMNDWFKYSGQTEEDVLIVNKWKYNNNPKCDQIDEQIKRNKKQKTERSC